MGRWARGRWARGRRPAALVAWWLAVAGALGAAVGLLTAPGAAAAPARSHRQVELSRAQRAVTPYYVALGASESVGFQPTPGHAHGVRSDRGYANDLTVIERSRWPGLQLVALGCPGIEAEAALHGGGPCHYRAGSEVAAATGFIRAHRTSTVLATVDLGFNDIWPCMTREAVRATCLRAAFARVGDAVVGTLRRLEAAGDPRLRIVGVLHNDPYLGDYLAGRRGRGFALASVAAISGLNRTLAAAYRRAGVLVANVPAAFETADRRLVSYPDHRRVPLDVARMCQMSWMCAPLDRGNIHPNASGYRAIARALARALAGSPPACATGRMPVRTESYAGACPERSV